MDHLARAINKCKMQPGGQQWGGYLVSAEIVALHRAGIVTMGNDSWLVDRAKESLRTGTSYSLWFYFTPRAELQQALRLAHPGTDKKVGTAGKL